MIAKRKKNKKLHKISAEENFSSKVSYIYQLIVIISILSVVFFAFYPALRNGFLNWDDPNYILDNAMVRTLSFDNVKKIFTSSVLGVYSPLTVLSFAIEYHFFGSNPFFYHLNNIMLHLGVLVSLFFVARQIGLSLFAAAFSTLIFGLHPMHVESVAWITERKDVLYSLFYVLAIVFYWKYVETKNRGFYLLSCMLGVLSMLAKPMALSLPLVLFLFDWMRERKTSMQIFLDKVPYFVYSIAIAWITFAARTGSGGEYGLKSIGIFIWTFMFYLHKFFFPISLSPFYRIGIDASVFDRQVAWSVVAFFVVLFGVWKCRKNKWVIFAFVYYFLSIFFLLRFNISNDFHIVADRFMYLPSAGFCFFIGVFFDSVLSRYKASKYLKACVYFFVIVLLGVLFVRTSSQTRIWKDNMTFWNHIIDQDPGNDIAYTSRADAYFMAGKIDLAKSDLDVAIDINPREYKPYFTRGAIYAMTGKKDLALNDLNKGIAMNQNTAEAYLNRGNILAEMNKPDLAIVDYNMALAIDPMLGIVYFSRGNEYAKLGRNNIANSDFDKAVQYYNPRFSSDYYYLYVIFSKRRQWREALNAALNAKKGGYNISNGIITSLRNNVGNPK